MADSAYINALPIQPDAPAAAPAIAPDHSLLVRVTHWVFTLSFAGLVISGFGILLAHPHFYWGETGGIGSPTLFSLPFRTRQGGPSGWGRSMHFQSAWLAILTGLLYVISGILSQHFRNRMLPTGSMLGWHSLRGCVADHLRLRHQSESYNLLQRISYLAVVFVLFPLTILSGLAMSPSITSVFPSIVIAFGGFESARTIHFFLANLLVLFVVVHVIMVVVAGFGPRMRAMITGRSNPGASMSQDQP